MIRLAAGVAAAKAVGTLARTAGRGGGTSLPGKVLTPRRAARDRAPREPAGARKRRDQRHQRQDHDGGDGGEDPRAHRAPGSSTTAPARTWPAASPARSPTPSRQGGRTLTGDFGLFEVDEFWLGPVVEELEPRAMLLGNLYRDQLDRYGELETIADRWAEIVKDRAGLVLNADDPLVADLGRHAPNPTYFGVDDDSLAVPELQHASDSKHCRRCGHAYEYTAIYLAHLGHYRCPNCGQERPEPSVVGDRRRAARHPQRRVHAARAARRAPPPRPLQRLQRARRRRADAQPGRADSTTSSPACRPSSPRSAAPRRSISAARRRSCW